MYPYNEMWLKKNKQYIDQIHADWFHLRFTISMRPGHYVYFSSSVNLLFLNKMISHYILLHRPPNSCPHPHFQLMSFMFMFWKKLETEGNFHLPSPHLPTDVQLCCHCGWTLHVPPYVNSPFLHAMPSPHIPTRILLQHFFFSVLQFQFFLSIRCLPSLHKCCFVLSSAAPASTIQNTNFFLFLIYLFPLRYLYL